LEAGGTGDAGLTSEYLLTVRPPKRGVVTLAVVVVFAVTAGEELDAGAAAYLLDPRPLNVVASLAAGFIATAEAREAFDFISGANLLAPRPPLIGVVILVTGDLGSMAGDDSEAGAAAY
jgi:hypothetical protein